MPIELRDQNPLLTDQRYIDGETDIYHASELDFRRGLEQVIPDDPLLTELILKPSVVVSIPLSIGDDSRVELPQNLRGVCPSVRVRHRVGSIDSPTKGGIRLIPLPKTVSETGAFSYITGAAIALSRKSLAKVCLINFPELCRIFDIDPPIVFAGGAKGVIGVPQELFQKAREAGYLGRMTNQLMWEYGYSYGIERVIDPRRDSVAPDIGTYGAQTMDELVKGYRAALRSQNTRMPEHILKAIATSKTVDAGGTPSRISAVGYGAVISLEYALKQRKNELKGKKILIDGAGNAAINAAEALIKKGAIVVGMSDTTGQIYNRDGITVDTIRQSKEAGLSIANLGQNNSREGELIGERDDYLSCPCDVVFLASGDHVVTAKNAQLLTPTEKIIVEASNLGISPLGGQYLSAAEIECIPGIVAGCGGLVSSWLEYIGNVNEKTFTLDEGRIAIEYAVAHAMTEMIQRAEGLGCSWSDSAFQVAAERAVEIKRENNLLD